jgi:hypothetical protein
MHEQNRANRFGWIAGAFFEQEQLHAAVLAGPMLFALDWGLGHFIHRSHL